jgi:hypothetical protein
MDIPQLFYRLAELSSQTDLSQLIQGSKVRVISGADDSWLTVGSNKDGKLVLLNDDGSDVCYSDLSVIKEVKWRSFDATDDTKISDAAMAAVSGK